MRIKRTLGTFAITLLLVAGAVYHYLFGYVVVERMADSVIVLHRKNILRQIGANVTIYTGPNETIVVDTQLRPLASATRSRIEALSNVPVSKVIITHWHPDHSGGISSFIGDSEVIAHENVLRRLSEPQEGFGLTRPGSHHEFPARNQNGLPNLAIRDQLTFSVEAKTVDVVHYPSAHTDGDLAVFFHDSETVVLGDLIWPNSFPFVDVANGGSAEGIEAALQAVIDQSTSAWRFVPGHGVTIGYADVVRYLEMVTDTRHWVESRLSEGKSLEQVIASGLPVIWEQWASPLVPADVWIKMIFDSRNT